MYSRRIWRVAQCLISIWIIPRRQQQHVQLCARKNFTFEYFLLGFRHSLKCSATIRRSKATVLLSDFYVIIISYILAHPYYNIKAHLKLQFWAYCCNWIESLLLLNCLADVPIGKWQQQQLLLPCHIFRVNTLACVCHMTISSTTTNELSGIWPGFYIQSCQNAEWNEIKTWCLLPIVWWFFPFYFICDSGGMCSGASRVTNHQF